MKVQVNKKELDNTVNSVLFIGDRVELRSKSKLIFSGVVESIDNDIYTIEICDLLS